MKGKYYKKRKRPDNGAKDKKYHKSCGIFIPLFF
jgi:hypothetical protein